MLCSVRKGIDIMEVYGMSECSGLQTLCVPYYHRQGCVGPPLSGCETILDHRKGRDRKLEGEICMRGRHIMMGYMYDEDRTKLAIDNEGKLHSGDVGKIDEYGLLSITGRIKELIITAGMWCVVWVECAHNSEVILRCVCRRREHGTSAD